MISNWNNTNYHFSSPHIAQRLFSLGVIRVILKTNRNNIKLFFSNFSGSPDHISEKLGLQPTMTAKQGQEYFTGSSDKRIIKIWKENLWCYDISIESNEWVSDFVDAFFNSIIIPRKKTIKELTATCECELAITLYYYDHWNPGFHFNKEIIQVLGEIGAELDLDIYCLKG